MPDGKKDSKAAKIKWLSKECWLMVFDDSLVNSPDRAEALMIMLMSVRHLMMSSRHSDRAKAFHAISNFINACQPYTRSEVVRELIEEERRRQQGED